MPEPTQTAKVDELVAIQSELREKIQPRLRIAGAPRTSVKFRELMKSLEGAIRHARLQEGRVERG